MSLKKVNHFEQPLTWQGLLIILADFAGRYKKKTPRYIILYLTRPVKGNKFNWLLANTPEVK